MPLSSITISQLVGFSNIETSDYIALVESSSLTTYKVPIQALFSFMEVTASCLSASYASSSYYSNSSSIAIRSISSSYSETSSFSYNSDTTLSSSYSLVSRVSLFSTSSITASFSHTASIAINVPQCSTASYLLYQGTNNGSSSFSITSSYSHNSSTASYALSISSGPSSLGVVPIGTIVDYAAASISDPNWKICDGSEILGSSYPELATLLGTGPSSVWGSASPGYIKLPDLRKRLTLGARGMLSDNIYNKSTPAIGGSLISGSVGNVGGGEAYQYHYHLMSSYYVTSGDDDFGMCFIGYNKSLSTHHMYPSRQTTVGSPPPANRSFPIFLLTGDASGRTQPWGYSPSATTTAYPALGTSFPVNDINTWFTCPSYPNDWQKSQWFGNPGTSTAYYDRQDLSMPYAVTNKIIRVL